MWGWWWWRSSAPPGGVMVKDVALMEESGVVVVVLHPLRSSHDCLFFSIPACTDVSVWPRVSRGRRCQRVRGSVGRSVGLSFWCLVLLSALSLRPVPGLPPLIEAGGCARQSCWGARPKCRWRSPSESLPRSPACDGEKDSFICSKLIKQTRVMPASLCSP